MKTLESKLRKDAQEILDREALKPLGDEFQMQLRATPQQRTIASQPQRAATWQWALPAMAAAMVVAYIALMPAAPDDDKDVTQAIITPVEPPTQPLVDIEKPAIVPVDYEQALVNEWQYIRNDLSLTKEKIEEDLSIQF